MSALRAIARGAAAVAVAALVASNGHAYIRLTNDGTGLFHRSRPIEFAIHQSGSDDVTQDQSEIAAIRLAFSAWSSIADADLAFRETAAGSTGPKVHANDGANLVFFDESNSTGLFTGAGFVIAITPIFYDAGGGIIDADIVFNGLNHSFATDLSGGRYDVQNIATHEVGHFIGLDHTGIYGATLVPFAYTQEIRLRSLAEDEHAAAATAYPGAGAAARGSFAGQVVRSSTGRGISGAHVVAVNAATGEPEASVLTSGSGTFTLELLRPATYRVYAEPLDGPATDANIQRDGVETGFATVFYGGIAQPGQLTLAPGQRNVQLGQLQVKDLGSSFNLDGAIPRGVLRGTTATVTVFGAGIAAGQEVEVAGSGVQVSPEPPFNHGVLGPGTSFRVSVDANAAPGLRDIYVFRGTGSAREMVALPGGFEVLAAAPQVQSASPDEGGAAGGEAVTIRGAGFAAGARVLFGDQIAGGVSVRSAAELTATAPPNVVGAVAIFVINPDGQQGRLANGYSYVGRPALASLSPAQGPSAGAVPVTIFGSQLSSSAQVHFDGRAATGLVVSEQGTRLDCYTPAGTPGVAADVSVSNPGAGGGTATLADAYRYVDPRIDSTDPPVGGVRGGTVVQILGDGFSKNARVDFGPLRATSVQWVSQFEIRATAPAGTDGTTVDLAVVTSDGRLDVAPGAFRWVSGTEPRIVSISPSRGTTDGGLSVRIVGSGFERTAAATFGGQAARTQWISDTEMLATSPRASGPGGVDVVVRNESGLQAKAFGAFTYDRPAASAAIGGGGGGGGGGGCRAAGPLGAADSAGALLPLLAALGWIVTRRRGGSPRPAR